MIPDLALQRNSRHEILQKTHSSAQSLRTPSCIFTYPCLCKIPKLKTPLQSLPISRQRPLAAIRYKQLLELGRLRGHESGVSEAGTRKGNVLVGEE